MDCKMCTCSKCTCSNLFSFYKVAGGIGVSGAAFYFGAYHRGRNNRGRNIANRSPWGKIRMSTFMYLHF